MANGNDISKIAKGRLATLKTGGPGLFAPPTAKIKPSPDATQIRNRQEAEDLPEGLVRNSKRKY